MISRHFGVSVDSIAEARAYELKKRREDLRGKRGVGWKGWFNMFAPKNRQSQKETSLPIINFPGLCWIREGL